MTQSRKEEMLILAPSHELADDFEPWQVAGPNHLRCPTDTVYNEWVEGFLDEGVFFPFDDDGRLPRDLPGNLDGFRCIMLDPARSGEFAVGAAAEALDRFRRMGGFVWQPWPLDAKQTATHMRGSISRVIGSAGLTQRHPEMLHRLRSVDDERLVRWWIDSVPEQARILSESSAGWAWGDPVAYHLFWPVWEAAQCFGRPEVMDPLWEMMRSGMDPARWDGPISCGKRFACKLYERTGDERIRERLRKECSGEWRGRKSRRAWQLDGVTINMDLTAPEGADAENPPPMVRENAWVWCETAGNLGDSFGSVSRITGDNSFVERAVRQVLTTHRWNFAPDIGLWYHMGRPTGPERRSAPWGRGNGWMLYGLRGLLEDLPDGHPARPELVNALAAGLEGLLRHQGPYGLWHNVLDSTEETSRQDTSGAWMIVSVYARAYWKGWLRDERIPVMCQRAWDGLKTKVWRGLPVAHCDGTPYMLSRQAYLERPHTKFMGHALLLAAVEMRRMRESRG